MEEKEVQYITPELPPPPVYFKSLTIENVKCFQGEHFIDLSNGKGGPAQWTVILGNNNTGKTTLLKCLAGMEAVKPLSNPNGAKIVVPLLLKLNFEYFWPSPKNQSKISVEIIPTRSLVSDKNHRFNEQIFESANIFSWFLEFQKQDFLVDSKITDGNIFAIHGATGLASILGGLIVYSFGTSRKMSKTNESYLDGKQHNIFTNNDLANIEDWLLNLYLATLLHQEKAQSTLDLAKKVITSGILPDVFDLEFKSETQGTSFENFVLFKTDYGPIRLHELGYGYQTMIAWILDLVRRMVERYPNSPNPLAEPAIVLVDEIDLHLHPDWQRKIIAHLTKHFPNTQFIVTAHSPLIVQSAEEVNLVILKKENDRVVVDQPNIRSFKGWTVEEIMTDLMQLEGQTMSNTYLSLMTQFDEALDEDDYEKAQSAYNQLDAILHPLSSQRKLLRLQMSALSQPNVV